MLKKHPFLSYTAGATGAKQHEQDGHENQAKRR